MRGPCSDNDGAKARSEPMAVRCSARCLGALRSRPCYLRMVYVWPVARSRIFFVLGVCTGLVQPPRSQLWCRSDVRAAIRLKLRHCYVAARHVAQGRGIVHARVARKLYMRSGTDHIGPANPAALSSVVVPGPYADPPGKPRRLAFHLDSRVVFADSDFGHVVLALSSSEILVSVNL